MEQKNPATVYGIICLSVRQNHADKVQLSSVSGRALFADYLPLRSQGYFMQNSSITL